MLTQMMTACMESVVQNQNTNNNTTIHNNNIPANSNTNPLGNNFSTLNFNQGLNLDPYNSFNNKRLKKVIPKKRRNNTNVSADLNPY